MITLMSPSVMLRRRIILEQDAVTLNEALAEQLSRVPGLWAPGKGPGDAAFEGPAAYDSASLNLHGCLAAGLDGQIFYGARIPGHVGDRAQSDDFMTIRFDEEKADYRAFVIGTLPKLIATFRPYRGACQTDSTVALDDWDEVRSLSERTGRNEDGRDSVYRIWPVAYYDDILCRRAFGLEPDEVVNRAAPACEEARLLEGGAFLRVTAELVTGREVLDEIHSNVMARLAD